MDKKVCLIINSLIIIVFMLCGCGSRHKTIDDYYYEYNDKIPTTEEVAIVLNERQKSILKKEGLPTDYNKLDFAQKSAIESIEDLLQHLEEKHGDRFKYIKYRPTGASGPEELLAKDLDRKELGTVTISCSNKKGKLVYEDDFEEREAEVLYKKELFEFLDKQIRGKETKCYIECTISDLGKKQDVIAKSSSINLIVLTGITTKQLDDLVTSYDEWMLSKKVEFATISYFCLVDEKNLKKLNNHDAIYDYMNDDKYIKCLEYFINSDGSKVGDY